MVKHSIVIFSIFTLNLYENMPIILLSSSTSSENKYLIKISTLDLSYLLHMRCSKRLPIMHLQYQVYQIIVPWDQSNIIYVLLISSIPSLILSYQHFIFNITLSPITHDIMISIKKAYLLITYMSSYKLQVIRLFYWRIARDCNVYGRQITKIVWENEFIRKNWSLI